MPFISVNGLSLLASFDPAATRSTLPNSAMDYLQSNSSGAFLVTAPTARGTFSTALIFMRTDGPTTTLGLDWFAYVREFYIAQGEEPPDVNSFSLNIIRKHGPLLSKSVAYREPQLNL